MANDARIGGAYFELSADSAKFSAGMKQAEQVAVGSTARIAKATDGVTQSVKAAQKEISSFVGIYTKLAGVAGAVATALSTVADVVDYLKFAFGDGNKAALEFLNTLGTGVGRQAEARLEQIRVQVAKVQAELAYKMESIDPRGRSRGTILGELQALRAEEAAVSKQVRAQADRAADAEAWRLYRERLKREREADAEKMKELHERELRNLAERWDYENARQEAADRAREQAAEEAVERERERLRLLEQQTAEVLRQAAAFRDLQDRQVGGFGLGNLQGSLDKIGGKIDRIAGMIPGGSR